MQHIYGTLQVFEFECLFARVSSILVFKVYTINIFDWILA